MSCSMLVFNSLVSVTVLIEANKSMHYRCAKHFIIISAFRNNIIGLAGTVEVPGSYRNRVMA